jgi:hypothetical protein
MLVPPAIPLLMSLPLPAAPLLTRVPAPAIPLLTLVVPPPPRISVVPAAPGPTTLVPAVGVGPGVVGPVPSSLQAIANRPATIMNSHLLVTAHSLTVACLPTSYATAMPAARRRAMPVLDRANSPTAGRTRTGFNAEAVDHPRQPPCVGIAAAFWLLVGLAAHRRAPSGSQPPVRRPVS